tara:strand:- start:359 stop:496 length:138 start_codon:yes stop_codon:yes gene_type:complete
MSMLIQLRDLFFINAPYYCQLMIVANDLRGGQECTEFLSAAKNSA